eukprot:m.412118 g.412118  ORF g.412118 m.412118 type:complete len:176 (-) comp21250_c0_seq4:423-950(-)
MYWNATVFVEVYRARHLVLPLHDLRMAQRTWYRADLNVIDLSKLNLTTPYVVDDLPNGAKRWMQSANGYKLTMLAGQITFANGQPTGALPGRLVRHPLRPHLHVRTLDQIVGGLSELRGPEPRSTNDQLVEDAQLVGGASAMRRAFDANRAEKISSVGQFLSGELLRTGAAGSKL